jgi:hypothetical protein
MGYTVGCIDTLEPVTTGVDPRGGGTTTQKQEQNPCKKALCSIERLYEPVKDMRSIEKHTYLCPKALIFISISAALGIAQINLALHSFARDLHFTL